MIPFVPGVKARVLLALLSFRNEATGRCDPAVASLCWRTNDKERCVYRALAELRDSHVIGWEERLGKTSSYRFLTPDESVSPVETGSPDESDTKPLTDSSQTPDGFEGTNSEEQNLNNDDAGDEIKECHGRDEPTLRGEADAFLRAMGITGRLRREFLGADVDLVLRWSEVDWKRDYPHIRGPAAWLTAALRSGDEPELKRPPKPSYKQQPYNVQEILTTFLRVLHENDRSPYDDRVWFEENADRIAALAEKGVEADGVRKLLTFAFQHDSMRDTKFSRIRDAESLHACWLDLYEKYRQTRVGDRPDQLLARTA